MGSSATKALLDARDDLALARQEMGGKAGGFKLKNPFKKKSNKRTYMVRDTVPGQTQHSADLFEKIGLNRMQIGRLFDIFVDMDQDGSNEIDVDEFFVFFGIQPTPFARMVFETFDRDGSGQVNFEEFVLTMWNICTQEEDDVTKFAFNVFDADGSGKLSPSETEAMLMAVCITSGEDLSLEEQMINEKTKVKVKKWASRVDKGPDGNVTQEGFDAFCGRYPDVLGPIYAIRGALKAVGGGDDFWDNIAKNRDFVIGTAKHMAINSYKSRHDNVEDMSEAASQLKKDRKTAANDQKQKVDSSFLAYSKKSKAKERVSRAKAMAGKYASTKGGESAASEALEAELRVRVMKKGQAVRRQVENKWKNADDERQNMHGSDPFYQLLKTAEPTVFKEGQEAQKKKRAESIVEKQDDYMRKNAESAKMGAGRKVKGGVAKTKSMESAGIRRTSSSDLRRRRMNSTKSTDADDELTKKAIQRARSERLTINTFAARSADKGRGKRRQDGARMSPATPGTPLTAPIRAPHTPQSAKSARTPTTPQTAPVGGKTWRAHH